jgi:DNA-directed RNA polymerase subunit M/transcription elongation factor TFIIS
MLSRALEVAPASARPGVHELLRAAGGEGERFARAVAVLVHEGAEAARAEVRRGRDGMDCDYCGAAGTVSAMTRQVRSADEGETAFYRCQACLRAWSS